MSTCDSPPQLSNIESTEGRSLKRRYTAAPDMSFFTSSVESFNPRPYLPHGPPSVNVAKSPPAAASTSKATTTPNTNAANALVMKPFDPSPFDPNVVFLHPPFLDFPDSHLYHEGLTYNILAENPEWFLDPNDFRTEGDADSDKIPYPTSLEPPRGWCPVKKGKGAATDSASDEDTPKLRCTFCRRKYAGVNAKSMWRRHVLEKHKIPMSNRRDGPHEGGRNGRGANKENSKQVQRGGRPSIGLKRKSSSDEVSRDDAMKGQRGYFSQSSASNGASRSSLLPAYGSSDDVSMYADRSMDDREQSYMADTDEHGQSPATSPQMPMNNVPSSSSTHESAPVNIPPESPYDPSKTPAFKHTSNRPRRQQPWRFPSPSHPLYSSPDELCLGVPVTGIVSEGLIGAYVPAQASPLSGVPTKEKRTPIKLSALTAASPGNSSPLCSKIVTGKILGWKRSKSDSKLRPALPPFTETAPRRLFSYQGPLPVPVTERLEHIQGDSSMDAGDELSTADSSFASDLGDPFGAWLTSNTESGSSLDLAAKLNFSDSPIIHASEIEEVDNLLGSAIDTNMWQRQASGVGLGIALSGFENGKAREDVNDLFFQFMKDDNSSGEWSLEGFANMKTQQQFGESNDEEQLTYPPASQDEQSGDDGFVSTQESSVNPYTTPMMSPPLKRRRTALV